MIAVGNLVIDPPVLLAPMAGVTDLPFRKLVARFGAGLVVSEMVATQEVLAGNPSAIARAEIAAGEVRTSVQIAGRDREWMAEAARRLAGQGAVLIDINMGCPARKVTSGACGAALMREPDRALALVEAVIAAVDVPVTVKMRLGWDETDLNAPFLAARFADAGVKLLTVHGRTRCQFYQGDANWREIRHVVDSTDIPVIANGDIICVETAREALRLSGAAGVMIGRGAKGRPWLLASVARELAGQPALERPLGADLAELVGDHYESILSFYGRDIGVRTARKHLDAYLAGCSGTAGLRERIIRETDPSKVLREISELANHDLVVDQVAA